MNAQTTLLAVSILCGATLAHGQDASEEPKFPDKYIVDYPAAERFCAPIQSTFYEVTRTSGFVRGKRFRQKPNGGYGLPVVDKVNGKNLLHVGADLGWYQVGEPVFAIANGVVRLSIGPKFALDDAAKKKPKAITGVEAAALPWGNLVVIEHRLKTGEFYTSIYGHLGTKRLVKSGDIVKAGQPIGMIGRQHARINGGYKPHLHLGILEGRIADVGAVVVRLFVNGRAFGLKLKSVGEEHSEVELPDGVTPPIRINFGAKQYEIEDRDGKAVIPSHILWRLQRPSFPLVGYSLKKDGFLDPVKFLRQQRADKAPAPYRVR